MRFVGRGGRGGVRGVAGWGIVGRSARLRGGKPISAFVGGGRGRRKGGRWECRMRRFEGSDYSGIGMGWNGLGRMTVMLGVGNGMGFSIG